MKQAVLLITRGQLASSNKFVCFKMVCYKYSSSLLTSLICIKGFVTSLFWAVRNRWEIKVLWKGEDDCFWNQKCILVHPSASLIRRMFLDASYFLFLSSVWYAVEWNSTKVCKLFVLETLWGWENMPLVKFRSSLCSLRSSELAFIVSGHQEGVAWI